MKARLDASRRQRKHNEWRAGGGECTHGVHGRSGMTVDPRIPTMPGRSTWSFIFNDQADIASTKREAP